MAEIEQNINLSADKNVSYCITLLKEIIANSPEKGKLLHKFKRSLNNLNNVQLIAVAESIGKFIQNPKNEENLLEPLLDNVLEMIKGII